MRVSSSMLSCYLCTLFYLTLVQAMFFTDSQENDYPRLGKRLQPLPKYLLKKWIGKGDNLYSYDPGNTVTGLPSLLPELIERDLTVTKETDSGPTSADVTKRDFVKRLWFYLSMEPEEF